MYPTSISIGATHSDIPASERRYFCVVTAPVDVTLIFCGSACEAPDADETNCVYESTVADPDHSTVPSSLA